MKAEYVPPREDIIIQNEAPDDVYVIVSGEVEIIYLKEEQEQVIKSLSIGEIFGEVSVLCDKPQLFTFRTKTLCQILRLKHSTLREAMQTNQKDSMIMLKNFLEHPIEYMNISIIDIQEANEKNDESTTPCNLLSVTEAGNSLLLEELLRAGADPDFGDTKGRTALHIAAEKGLEDCVLVLMKHGCNVNINDMEGNTPLWLSITKKNCKIFSLLYHHAFMSNPRIGGNLLCDAAKRNDVSAMKDLLDHGLNINAENDEGFSALQISVAENHDDMVRLLIMNGAKIDKEILKEWKTEKNTQKDFDEMVESREIGHPIAILESSKVKKIEMTEKRGRMINSIRRVSIYRGHPTTRSCHSEAGKLIRLPNTIDELNSIISEKFGIDEKNIVIANEDGAEIDSVELIRDNDRLYIHY